jgi:DNA primase
MSTELAKKRVLDRVPLASLVGESVKLASKPGYSIGLCPFHSDKAPSFRVFPDHYYCFGCRKHGDAITWVREREGLGFIEAIRYLASKYGIEVPELDDPAQRQRQEEATRLYRVMASAQGFFTEMLRAPAGAKARDYLLGRGFTQESLTDFGFGYAPDTWDSLILALRREGFRERELETCSLALARHNGSGHFDFFRERATVPIHDPQGRVIAFAGRTLNDDTRKYMNSGDTPLFHKKSTVFGLHRAKAAMRESKYAVIVEGQMDVLMLWQHGLRMTVASMGTALTEHHLRQLSLHTKQVYLLFDGDSAGQKSMLEMADIACAVPQLEIKVAILPPPKDPDEFVRDHGVGALNELFAKSTDLTDFAIRATLQKSHGSSLPDILQKSFVPWLARVSDPVQRGWLNSRVSEHTGVPAAEIERLVRASRGTSSTQIPATAPPAAKVVPARELTPLQRELLGHLFFAPLAELDVPALISFVADQLELGEPWLTFANDLAQSHAQGNPPAEAPVGGLESVTIPEVEKLVDWYRANKAAFACQDRPKQISRIRVMADIKQKQTLMKTLKSHLSTVADEQEKRQILISITEVSRSIADLERQLR